MYVQYYKVSDDDDSLKNLKALISIRVPPRSIRRKGGKTSLTYEERLKRMQMMMVKNNAAVRELNIRSIKIMEELFELANVC